MTSKEKIIFLCLILLLYCFLFVGICTATDGDFIKSLSLQIIFLLD